MRNRIEQFGFFYERKRSLIRAIRDAEKALLRELPEISVPKVKPKVSFMEGLGGRHDVEYRRDGDTILISLDWRFARYLYPNIWEHIVAQYFWYASCGPDVGPILVNTSDGDYPSLAQFAASSNLSDVTLLPDTHFFRTHGYKKIGEHVETSDVEWDKRSDEIIWRGCAFGGGIMSFAEEMKEDPSVVQRVRMAQKTKGSEIDFRFVEHRDLTEGYHVLMLKADLMGERVEEPSWITRKYAIDIDGFTNAWSNLFIRLKLGCCVFKVDSDFGYRQWYYDRLKPYEHYIPVKADLSDLFEQVEWAKTHQVECKAIAANGRALVDGMTFEKVRQEAVERITGTMGA